MNFSSNKTLASLTRFRQWLAAIVVVVISSVVFFQTVPAEEPSLLKTKTKKLSSAESEFFETHIRPTLVNHCYDCHQSGEEAAANLVLDFREGLRKGGDSGPLLNFKEPSNSLLLKVLRHEIEELEMPAGEDKLSNETITNFETWIKMGAPDPRNTPPSGKASNLANSWETTLEKRKQWWSFRPIQSPQVPNSGENSWSTHPIDRFIHAQLESQKLKPAQPANKRSLIRRLTYVLTGLPPTPQQIKSFLEDTSSNAFDKVVDRLLASDRFGERWARHWMDWIRYTNTHGSEGDPTIPFSYQYRDYLIRALNKDVPYDQLVREHVAGDLLPNPRINPELEINESAIGTAHWRMVFHGFAPTDALEEKVRFTDDQINVYSKAFLGLTISCARCHNHKFDAISQADFYALFGILGSTRPATIDVNTAEKQSRYKTELTQLKSDFKQGLIQHWQTSSTNISAQLSDPKSALHKQSETAKSPDHVLHLWKELSKTNSSSDFQTTWKNHRNAWKAEQDLIKAHQSRKYYKRWDFSSQADYNSWHRDGNGLPQTPSVAGELSIASSGEKLLTGIYPAGIYTHSLSQKHRGMLSSPHFNLDDDYDIWLRTVGTGKPLNRFAVQHYPRNGTVFPFHRQDNNNWHWSRFDLSYWKGDDIHLEVSTTQDQPILVTGEPNSWFGLREVVAFKKGTPAPPEYKREYLTPLYEAVVNQPPKSKTDLARLYQQAINNSLTAWKTGKITDASALFLDACLKAELLPNNHHSNSQLQKLLTQYRDLVSRVPQPTRSPGLQEADVIDQPLMVRGNHKQLNNPVPRRFLEAIDDTPYANSNSGRLSLANDTVRPDNPLASRVIVNRLWHYVYGAGLVRTPDNFGQLGEKPTHPELLDYLAQRFMQEGWSIKKLIKFMVTSQTFQLSSKSSLLAEQTDPLNKYWSHASLRRLEAEAIRDSILAVSGQLNDTMYGPGYQVKSKSTSRSVYGNIRRNTLDQFLATFNAPTPFATKGRRDATNVPAQSLTLLNDPFVINSANKWVESLFKNTEITTTSTRVGFMFEQAFGRQPTPLELKNAIQYLDSLNTYYQSYLDQFKQVQQLLTETNKSISQILVPVQQQLQKQKNPSVSHVLSAEPIAYWDFEKNLQDKIGNLHGKLNGTARLEKGSLVLDGNGYVSTTPLTRNLSAKTLEAWVQLKTLDQQGGGAVTVQSLDGTYFDSIVFAERRTNRWMAGSNYALRSLNFDAYDEREALEVPVHIAITYDKAGNIRGYRNGQPYGKSIRKSDLHPFNANETQILFGLRHSPAGRNKLLKGRILEARLYDRALTAAEIETSSKTMQTFVSLAEIHEHLSPTQKQQISQLETQRNTLQQKLNAMGKVPTVNQSWIDLAHALFNLKNFLYLD